MFYSFKDSSVRLTGRWSEVNNAACATAPGSFFTFSFKGKWAVLNFDTTQNIAPLPHLWISVDDNTKYETCVSPFLRIETQQDCTHTVTVIFKSAVEVQHRWHNPLIGAISFLGYEAQACAQLPADNKKTIEFVGDSITEGVLIEEFRIIDKTNNQNNRVFQDDSTATFAYITAKRLNLTPLMMGYGAVGTTKGGCGGVPKAAVAYPYCFEDAKVSYSSPDFILINHGANDRGAGAQLYIKNYNELLDVIRKINPLSKIICLSPFCGAFSKELKEFVEKYNDKNSCDILFINSSGWVPVEPLHPTRQGHEKIAENLTKILKEELSL